MTGFWWADLLLSLVGIALVLWLVLMAALFIFRPRGGSLAVALRLLPDVLGMLRRMAGDSGLPRGVRVRLALLVVYLAVPIDLIPDFVPVLGYADDAIIAVLVLRSVVRQAGLGAVRRHWRGSEDGFAVLCRMAHLTEDGGSDAGRPAPST